LDAKIEKLAVSVFQVPTEGPESDGTLKWESTTLVLVEVQAGNVRGLGYTYASASTGLLIREKLQSIVEGQDAMDVQGTWDRLRCSMRNLGGVGITAMALAAVDIALWDLKARLLKLPLVKLLGQVRAGIPAYGSGGFTSYSMERLQQQLGGWAKSGLRSVKMKVGREPHRDQARVQAAREAIGPDTELYVDANGAYTCKQALEQAKTFESCGVTWFEEPVTSDDLAGLRWVRERAPAAMRVAAGEYGYEVIYFRRLLEAGAVDVVQADASRCGGLTGFLQAGTLADAFMIPFSAHTVPSVHQHPCCALGRACGVEYFYDHYRIEEMLFDGAAKPIEGELRPDLSRPGLGLEFKRADAQRYAV